MLRKRKCALVCGQQCAHKSYRDLFAVEMPRIYNNRVRNAVLAGPTSLDTRRIHPYFNRLGSMFARNFVQEQLIIILKMVSTVYYVPFSNQ
jgi:hypothetical protein